ncbi:MAG TPA: TerC/Alx family metal homeostasis membrane protein [Rhodothermales bacterium]|nr:TerC/Alx family metal homeostasis membrane protein [Rhodothermales bacterium]
MRNGSGSEIPVWGWITFGVVVVVLLLVDLLTIRGKRATSRRVAAIWSIIWVGTGLGFAVFLWFNFGGRAAEQYLAAYLIEKSLSLDNLFLFLLVFQSLKIEPRYQHEVLFWGILGAVVFRGIFIFIGASALERFGWVSYVFGAVLLYGAYRAFRKDPSKLGESKIVRWLSEHLPVTREVTEGKFIRRENGKRVATPLLIALIAIELTDVVFAIDSVPAALTMTRDRFLVYSSNVFAILGLRALYLLLAHTIAGLKYLHYGLAMVLLFAAVKIVGDPWFEIQPLVSVGVIIVVIGTAILASLRARRHNR